MKMIEMIHNSEYKNREAVITGGLQGLVSPHDCKWNYNHYIKNICHKYQ
jgi:hypothetical protein